MKAYVASLCQFLLVPLSIGSPQDVQAPEQRDKGTEPKGVAEVAETLNANEHDKIRAAVGRTVAVRGKVRRVGGGVTAGIHFIIFEGNERGQFVGIVKTDNILAIIGAVGGDLKTALTGKSVELRGTMELYTDNTPQIVVKEPNQIRVLKE